MRGSPSATSRSLRRRPYRFKRTPLSQMTLSDRCSSSYRLKPETRMLDPYLNRTEPISASVSASDLIRGPAPVPNLSGLPNHNPGALHMPAHQQLGQRTVPGLNCLEYPDVLDVALLV